ncbi:MAG: HD-GYP domain-containing protein [Halomonadaceae bacterium]|nr:MAG: HD-GYP domain-containing protein [Halomonadaceae bacterium]
MVKRIPLASLKVGMFISDQNNDWIPHNKDRRRGFIRNEETIERIRRLGTLFVYIDTDRGLDSNDGEPVEEVEARNEAMLQKAAEAAPHELRKVALEDEMSRARDVHTQAQGLVDNLMKGIKLGRAVDLTPVKDLATELQQSVFNNPNALSALGRIRDKDNYLLEHSVNLSVLISIFGKGLELEKTILHELIIGALLHDIGKILTPDDLLHKPGKLTPAEFEIVKLHVSHSRDILKKSEGIGEVTLLTAAQHHERMDGTGYPEGLGSGEISLYGRMAAVADVYDAITADRIYHKAMTPTQGMKKLLEWSGHHLDGKLVAQFIRCLGIYPVGSTVLLDSGRLAVVIENNPEDQRLPVVRVFYHARLRQKIMVQTLDLSRPNAQDRIKQSVDPADYNADIRPFLDW